MAAACRVILAAAIRVEEPLPTSWFEVSDRVEAASQRAGCFHPVEASDLVFLRLNDAVNTNRVPFPRAFG